MPAIGGVRTANRNSPSREPGKNALAAAASFGRPTYIDSTMVVVVDENGVVVVVDSDGSGHCSAVGSPVQVCRIISASVEVTEPLEFTSQVQRSQIRSPTALCRTNTALTTQRALLKGFPHVKHASSASLQVAEQASVAGQVGSPMHTPSSQWSLVVQNKPSSQGLELAMPSHDPFPSHWFSVHGLPSLSQGTPCGAAHASEFSLQAWLQTESPLAQGFPVPEHAPL